MSDDKDKRDSRTVRVSKDLYDRVSTLSKKLKPQTTIQYVIEDALIDYLNQVDEQSPGYRTKEDEEDEEDGKKGRAEAC